MNLYTKFENKIVYVLWAGTFLCLILMLLSRNAVADNTHGIWVKDTCRGGGAVKIVNQYGMLDIIPLKDGMRLQISEFLDAPGNKIRKVKNLNSDKVFDVELSYNSYTLNKVYKKCGRLPGQMSWKLGEAVAGFHLMGKVTSICKSESGEKCIETVFKFVDVSDDDVLSKAEISRVIRILGFYAGYMTQKEMLVKHQAVMISTTIAGVASTIIANSIIGNVDYDDDGRVSIEELLQDRGEGADLVDLGGGVTADLMRNMLLGMISQAPNFLGKILNLQ